MEFQENRLGIAQLYRSVRQIPPIMMAVLVFIFGMIVSMTAWRIAAINIDREAKTRFEYTSDEVAQIIKRRMVANQQILRGGVALFEVHPQVTRMQWHDYVAGLRFEESFPGIQGVGFSLRVPAVEKDRHVRTVRAEGFPEYEIRPAGPREEYHSIVFLEPFWGRNLRAFGYDMMSEPVRRAAMERARDNGETSLTGKVTLVQENNQDVQAGFLMYVPVYRKGMPKTTIEQRREALVGFVYSPFRAKDLLGNLMANYSRDLAVTIYAGEQETDQNLLFTSQPDGDAGWIPRYSTQREIMIAGMPWMIRTQSLPAFESSVQNSSSLLLLVAGMITTTLMTLIVITLSTTRNRATALAQKMSQQLLDSESRLRSVLDSAPDGIVTVDGRGRIESINHSAEHIFGVQQESIAGTLLETLIVGLNIGLLWNRLEKDGSQGEKGRRAQFEGLGRRATGEEFPLSISVSDVDDVAEIRFSLIIRDITDAKYAESILRLRDRVIESSSNGIVIAAANLPGLPIMYVNPAFERITGYEAGDMVGRNCNLLQGDDRDQPGLEELRAALAEKRSTKVLLRNYRRDGSLFWNELSISPVADEKGEVTHYVGIQNDVTERIQSQQTLEVRTQHLNAVFTLSPDGFVAFDREGKVSEVNPAFLRMVDMPTDGLIGLTLEAFDRKLQAACDPLQPYVSLMDDQCIGSECLTEDGERRAAPRHTLYLAAPGHRILQRSLMLGRNANGDKVAYFRDVTRETEIDRIKSEFLSTAAHELRTPMASIFGFSELLLRRKYDAEKQADLISTINRQAGILINLINELLDLARIEARAGKDFKYRITPLNTLIENTVASLLIQEDHRRVQVADLAELPEVRIDEEKFGQALINVLSNAYKYSPSGGSIELDTLSGIHDGRAEIGIRVRDHGIGMKPDQLARLFERFYRADPSGKIPGTGLGMCLVKEIVELHGGRVEVSSEFGQGTTVILWLPLLETERIKAAA